MSQPPFSTFSGRCRGFRNKNLGPLGQAVADVAIGGYFRQLTDTEREEQNERFEEIGFTYVIKTDVGKRRYANQFVSRDKYHTLCIDEFGNDYGTLVREIQAYINPLSQGNITVQDFPLPEYADEIERLLGRADTPAIAIDFVSLPEFPNPCIQKLVENGFLDATVFSQSIVRIMLPTQLQQFDFKKVIDLRLPKTRDWLVKELRDYSLESSDSIIGKWCFEDGSPAGAFEMLLPSLYFWELGGNEFTTMLGTWFVGLGAEALIFPSARSNARAEFQNGELSLMRGWNLLDFSEFPLSSLGLLSLGGDLEQRVASDQIRFHEEKHDPEWIGSIAVEGMEETLEQIRRRKVDSHYELLQYMSSIEAALDAGKISLDSPLPDFDRPAGATAKLIEDIATVQKLFDRMSLD